MNKHIPVLLQEVLEGIPADREQLLIADCTFGGGGHTRAILDHFEQASVLACDFDDAAIQAGQKKFAKDVALGRVQFHHGSFTTLPDVTGGYDAIFADLGYSSNQLENPEYGMSFQLEGPLDMRLSRPPEGPTAWDVIHDAPLPWLAGVLKNYGEIKGAEKFARRLREAVQSGAITDSTLSLARWMEKNSHSRPGRGIHPATTLFQALRIAVNDELRSLDEFLKTAILKLKPGGRLLVITFHSLEDRVVKRACTPEEGVRAITKKPIEASDTEVKTNARSRSAKLRVYERTGR